MEGCCGWTYQKHSRNIAIFLITYTSLCSLLTVGFGTYYGIGIFGRSALLGDNTNIAKDPETGVEWQRVGEATSVDILFYGILVVLCIHAVLPVTASGLLLFGSIMKDRIVILIWVVFTMIQIFCYLALICGCFIDLVTYEGTGGPDYLRYLGSLGRFFFLGSIMVAFSIHFLIFSSSWIVVFLFYRELTKKA